MGSVSLASGEIPRMDRSSYVVSARRILISYRILEALGSKIFWIFIRGFRFIPFQVVKGDREIRVAFVADPQQLERRIRRFRPLLRPAKTIFDAKKQEFKRDLSVLETGAFPKMSTLRELIRRGLIKGQELERASSA